MKKTTDDSIQKKSPNHFRASYSEQRAYNNIVPNLMLTKETKDDTKNITEGNDDDNVVKNRVKSNNNKKKKSKGESKNDKKIHCQCIIF